MPPSSLDLALRSDELDADGTEGWELAGCFPIVLNGTTTQVVYIFKREAEVAPSPPSAGRAAKSKSAG
jgi:hypothetical protein